MVKLHGPSLSIEGTGNLASLLNFSTNKGRRILRRSPKPKLTRSPAQLSIRAMNTFLAKSWKYLSTPDQTTWSLPAGTLSISPYHAYLKANMLLWRQFLPPTMDATRYDESPPASIAQVGIFPLPRGLDHRARADPLGAGWGFAYFMSTTFPFTQTWDKLVYVWHLQDTNWQTWIQSPLQSGTYNFRISRFSKYGRWFHTPNQQWSQTIP